MYLGLEIKKNAIVLACCFSFIFSQLNKYSKFVRGKENRGKLREKIDSPTQTICKIISFFIFRKTCIGIEVCNVVLT